MLKSKKLASITALCVALLFIAGPAPLRACTIFTLTDADRALFCNNEDWENPKTRIWFVPGEGDFGCAYVGFDNGFAQGGVSTQGLAFDWVAGFKERWDRTPKMGTVEGNPSELMLQTCATIEDAIAFYQTHWEPSFSTAKILIADRTGASVVIGAKDGRLEAVKAKDCRAFGYRGDLAGKRLADDPEPTAANAARILRAAMQEGKYATKYSNVFDLKTGDIFLYRFPDWPEPVKLNLAEELKKGAHYFDMPKIADEMKQPLKPLSWLKPWWKLW